jgi:hypothetical protein
MLTGCFPKKQGYTLFVSGPYNNLPPKYHHKVHLSAMLGLSNQMDVLIFMSICAAAYVAINRHRVLATFKCNCCYNCVGFGQQAGWATAQMRVANKFMEIDNQFWAQNDMV